VRIWKFFNQRIRRTSIPSFSSLRKLTLFYFSF